MKLGLSVWVVAAALLFASFPVTAQKIVIRGSNTFGEELGPRLIEEFRKINPTIDVELESKGTGSGFAALLAGNCDIAAASRPANEDELRLARSRGIQLIPHTVGYYGVAVIVNDANPVRGLSDTEVRDIFSGAVANWKATAGVDAPIRTYIRDPISGAYLGFQELAMERKDYAASAQKRRSDAELIDAVASDKLAVGYVGMQLSLPTAIRAVNINGIPASALSVNEGLYPYARLLFLYTNRAQESAAARKFIRFVQSRRGQDVLESMGFVRRFTPRGLIYMSPGL